MINKNEKISKNKILTEISGTMDELLQLISSFDEDKINLTPFEGSWTAGQVVKHILKSNYGFLKLLNGPIKETERKQDDMVKKIKNDFLDFNTKMNAPDFVVPAKINYQKDYLLNYLEDIKTGIIKAIETSDLTKTCTAFEVPGYGLLTRLEAIYFILYHTQRHIHQLKNIFQKLSFRRLG